MSFEMSLPHPPRILSVAADGTEAVAQDEKQWQLYYTVQHALQQEAAGQKGDAATAAAVDDGRLPVAPQPSEPQKVLDKLMTARGELDVIADLVTFVEQQQFLAVEGVHRHPASLEERLRTRSLRLATSKQQLRGASERLAAGLGALQAQAEVDNRFLADLSLLRRWWKLRRHAGAAAMFYADISLPVRSGVAQGITQEGMQCNIIQDTNGDACIVEPAEGGKRRAVRGWQQIHAMLEVKQRLLAWRVLQQMVAAQARQAQYEADGDRAVAAVQQLMAAAESACQTALQRAVSGSGVSGKGAADMDVDGGGEQQKPLPLPQQEQQEEGAAVAVAPAVLAVAGVLPVSMLSSAAIDIQTAVGLPGFQQQFESRALLLLSQLMTGSSSGSSSNVAEVGKQKGVLYSLLRWLHHTALCHRVGRSLRLWCTAAAGRSLRRIASGEEFAAVWHLVRTDCAGIRGSVPPLLVIVQGGRVQLEGGGPETAALQSAAASQPQPGLSGAELDRILLSL